MPAKRKLTGFQGGFAAGLARMVSVSGVSNHRPFPGTKQSAAEALGSDWKKLGGDMRRAASAVSLGKR